ncbi:protein-L-isoaspartate O-methyltransferase family protein [Cellulomonas edaphi]|uniref:Protein-L-isoaspartate O-methyltransferase n=1 Tax=Cellulomonas edaphi TaxID=3053468 RepID=A0ABT7S460_9CELL|nr:fibrillarin-like rRNA/tRNA 2'-O-methyltransferase [Cellulomons edaphi]MDM7830410.1 fibrillarin-like rRNA/tRNA 2'-O-methyltransferase [Cellulomons edaphi]
MSHVQDPDDDAVARAMRAQPRARFLPRRRRPFAAQDRPLPLWHGQTSSQPSTVAAMLRLLQVNPGAAVLDVGAGSGWTTAILAQLVGPTGEVLGVELDPELAAWGAANLYARGMGWARIERAVPGSLGRERAGGWDRILVSAAATELPAALVEQLGPSGRMMIPVRTTMHLVERTADGVTVSTHGSYSFVPLR